MSDETLGSAPPAPAPEEPVPQADAAPSGAATTYTVSGATASSQSVRLSFDAPYEVDRWRVIGNPIMAIPHIVVLYVLGAVAGVLWLVNAIALIITGKMPNGLRGFIVLYQRYAWRVYTFVPWLRDQYPPFAFDTDEEDPGTDPPATYSVTLTNEIGRWEPLYRWVFCIIPAIVLAVFGIVAYVMLIISFFQVLFTGKWNESFRKFVLRVMRQGLYIGAYLYLLVNDKPEMAPPE
jgi:hypothetical protein